MKKLIIFLFLTFVAFLGNACFAASVDAGTDQKVFIDDGIGSTVYFYGTTSDFDIGCSLAFNWTETSSHGITINNANTQYSANFITSSFTSTSVVTAQLEVIASSCVDAGVYTDSVDIYVYKNPTLDAGDNKTVDIGDTVYLDGSITDLPAGCTPMYSWSENSTYGITIENDTSLDTAYFETSSFTSSSTVEISLFVDYYSCGIYGYDDDTVTIQVEPPTPRIDAGTNQTVNIGDTVYLDGSTENFPSGCTLDYKWTELSSYGVSLSDWYVLNPSFDTSGFTSNSTVEMELEVIASSTASTYDSCGYNGTYTDTVSIDVTSSDSGGSSFGERMRDEADVIFRNPDNIKIVLERNPYKDLPFIQLDWTFLGGEGFISYELQWSNNPDFSNIETYYLRGNKEVFNTYRLDEKSIKSYFRVRAVYKDMHSPWSNTYIYMNDKNIDPLDEFKIVCIGCEQTINFEDIFDVEELIDEGLDVDCKDYCDLKFDDMEEFLIDMELDSGCRDKCSTVNFDNILD